MALIETVLAEPITTSTWQAINSDSTTATKFIARTRAGNAFRLSEDSSGNTYLTIQDDEILQDTITSTAGLLFYAQAVDANDTLEVWLS
jgi:hypothetical protein